MVAEESARCFATAASRFETAMRESDSLAEYHFRICGESARVRIAGGLLAERLAAPLEHLSVADDDGAADLRIDLWDERASGVGGLAAAKREAGTRRWDLTDGSFAVSQDGRFVSHEFCRSLSWLDRRRGHIVACFEDGASLTLHQRGKPLQMLLALRASDRGLQAVHAACVARGENGVLVPGRSGAGKSTVSFTCLRAGYSCLGDDWVGVARGEDGSLVGHGLYSSLYLEPAHARRLGCADTVLHSSTTAVEEKPLTLAASLFPGQFASAARIRAVLLPRFVPGSRSTTVRPASQAEALLSLVPSSVFTLRPRLGGEGVERLAELARELPAYWLETGTDLDDIPRCVDELLSGLR